MLVNDGSGNYHGSWLAAPYQSPTTDYAVEADIQFLKPASAGVFLRVRSPSRVGFDGYWAGTERSSLILWGASQYLYGEQLGKRAFDAGKAFHTYRLEAKASHIRVLLDGSVALESDDLRATSGSSMGLFTFSDGQFNVRGFKVIAL